MEKELANIRAKFKNGNSLTAYDKKKYVWKILYIYMLGYDVEFGHMEAVGLVSGTKYSEKQVGYLVTSVLLNESNEFLRIVINSMRKGASPARARRPPPPSPPPLAARPPLTRAPAETQTSSASTRTSSASRSPRWATSEARSLPSRSPATCSRCW